MIQNSVDYMIPIVTVNLVTDPSKGSNTACGISLTRARPCSYESTVSSVPWITKVGILISFNLPHKNPHL